MFPLLKSMDLIWRWNLMNKLILKKASVSPSKEDDRKLVTEILTLVYDNLERKNNDSCSNRG